MIAKLLVLTDMSHTIMIKLLQELLNSKINLKVQMTFLQTFLNSFITHKVESSKLHLRAFFELSGKTKNGYISR